MLEFAKKYEEELKRIYFETVFDDSFKWVWLGTGREWYAPQDKTSEYHSFVSTHNGNVLGEIGYHKDVPARKADGFYCCHYTKDNGYIFMKDLLACVRDVFEKFGMNKLSYCVVVGNPIEPAWDKLTKKFRGRVIGVKEQDIVLEDNKFYDVKEYEITAKNYFDALGIKRGKPTDAEKEAKNRIGEQNLQVLERIKNEKIDISKIMGGIDISKIIEEIYDNTDLVRTRYPVR